MSKENKEREEGTIVNSTNEIPNELTYTQAINVLIQAAGIGQSKGVYSFEESTLIYKAIKTFTPKNTDGGNEKRNEN